MQRLRLTVAPAMPDQGCRFIAREPSLARLALSRQGNAHVPMVETFLRMVVDGRSQCLEIAPRATVVAAMLSVCQAGLGIDLRQHPAAPEFVQTTDPGDDLELIPGFADIGEIDREDISAVDF